MAIRLVLWDIDGTLIRGSMERHFLRFLLQQEHITWPRLISNVARLISEQGGPLQYRAKVAYLRGLPPALVSDLADEAWCRFFAPNLYHNAAAAVRRLSRIGVNQVLLSGTIAPLARRLAESLDVRHVLAGQPEVIGGQSTGRLEQPQPRGLRKVIEAEAWLGREGYRWDEVAAVGNAWADRHLLTKAGKSVALHPDRRLGRLARRSSWICMRRIADGHELTGRLAVQPLGVIQNPGDPR